MLGKAVKGVKISWCDSERGRVVGKKGRGHRVKLRQPTSHLLEQHFLKYGSLHKCRATTPIVPSQHDQN